MSARACLHALRGVLALSSTPSEYALWDYHTDHMKSKLALLAYHAAVNCARAHRLAITCFRVAGSTAEEHGILRAPDECLGRVSGSIKAVCYGPLLTHSMALPRN